MSGADEGSGAAGEDEDTTSTGYEELTNETLSSLLLKETRLTRAEWDSCGISVLRSNHYIKAGGYYYRPDKPLPEQLHEFASLTRMSDVGNALVCSERLGDSTAKVHRSLEITRDHSRPLRIT